MKNKYTNKRRIANFYFKRSHQKVISQRYQKNRKQGVIVICQKSKHRNYSYLTEILSNEIRKVQSHSFYDASIEGFR